jgi:hypothetical protein
LVKKLLLASVFAIASIPGHALADTPDEAYCKKEIGTDGDYHGGMSDAYQANKLADWKRCLRKRAADRNPKLAQFCVEQHGQDGEVLESLEEQAEFDRCMKEQASKPRAQVTVTPPYQGPRPIGCVWGPYTQCANPPQCSMGVVNVPADGLNVRVVPNGPPIMSLVNGTPLIPFQKQGDWLLVAPACDLTPTWVWSWNAGVPLNRCWVYF